jgi:hypothetical protein
MSSSDGTTIFVVRQASMQAKGGTLLMTLESPSKGRLGLEQRSSPLKKAVDSQYDFSPTVTNIFSVGTGYLNAVVCGVKWCRCSGLMNPGARNEA